MSGENLDNFLDIKNILVDMGTFFQVQVTLFHNSMYAPFFFCMTGSFAFMESTISLFFQDDYLDCFGDPEAIGKVSASLSLSHTHTQLLDCES